jgi:hypothetical protein
MKTLLLAVVVFSCGLFIPAPAHGATTNVYFTQFEAAVGYDLDEDLIGQAGWVGGGSGGNGLLTNYISGQGQQAYIGFQPPAVGDDVLFVWRPINFNPIAAGYPIVKFSTQMQIRDSTNNEFDYFQWQVFNSQGDRLLTLDFDVYFTNINYQLDGTNEYVDSGISFPLGSNTFSVSITMDFAANRWGAALNQTLITTNQPITTTSAPLNLGDIDAVWSLYDVDLPGDNFMVFDNYQITAENRIVPPAQIQLLSRSNEGWALVRVNGANDTQWAVDASTNLSHWTALKTNPVSGGFFDHIDQTAAGSPHRFYRARHVP